MSFKTYIIVCLGTPSGSPFNYIQTRILRYRHVVVVVALIFSNFASCDVEHAKFRHTKLFSLNYPNEPILTPNMECDRTDTCCNNTMSTAVASPRQHYSGAISGMLVVSVVVSFASTPGAESPTSWGRVVQSKLTCLAYNSGRKRGLSE